MVTAMMLPTATGLLHSFAMVVRARRHPSLLQALVVVGFATLRLAVGFLVCTLNEAVHSVGRPSGGYRPTPAARGRGTPAGRVVPAYARSSTAA